MLNDRIKKIVDSNNFNQYMMADFANNQAIPDVMIKVRETSFDERKKFYLENRIIEQKNWYINKSKFNKNKSFLFFIVLIIISIIVCAMLFINISISNCVKLPIEILLSVMSALFVWIQTRKYNELEKSYAIVAHEINNVETDIDNVIDESTLSQYVINAENAFSREHTQWLAKKIN